MTSPSSAPSGSMPTYAEIHLWFTLPPCLALFLIHRPLLQGRDLFRLLLLTAIAVAATIPWDSYLIRTGVWTYPEGVVLGTLFDIPVEEIAFFVIQTYLTTQLYALLNKPTFHPALLPPTAHRGPVGAFLFLSLSLLGGYWVYTGGPLTYTGLILAWACPVLALLWFLSGPHALRLPWTKTLGPVGVATLYLWGVDTYALRKGVWAIGGGTKVGWQIWEGLEFEEALFFLVSNTLLVLGSVAFSHAFALADVIAFSRPNSGLDVPPDPLRRPLQTISRLYAALTLREADYPGGTIHHLRVAASTLRKHSKSFHLASSVFGEKCRLLLLSYYAFCRVTDDLVDDAPSKDEAARNVKLIERFLGLCYPGHPGLQEISPHAVKGNGVANGHANTERVALLPMHDSGYVDCWASPEPVPVYTTSQRSASPAAPSDTLDTFLASLPQELQPAFSLFRLLVPHLPPEPVYDLLKGYAFDALAFSPPPPSPSTNNAGGGDSFALFALFALAEKVNPDPPVPSEAELILYCRRVAGSVGVACTHLMHAASGSEPPTKEVLQSASDMGVALQLVNIARDLVEDAKLGRSYVPSSWASASQVGATTAAGILANPQRAISIFRPKLLGLAFRYFQRSAPALDHLPAESRIGAKAAVSCYMAMGVLMHTGWFWRKGRWSTFVKMVVVLLVLYVPRWRASRSR